jgi:hypothetical protein
MKNEQPSTVGPRAATLDWLIENTLPNFVSPVPSRETLRSLFDREGVPRMKANCAARRGGGPVYYQVCAVEKLFRAKLRSPVMG